jgi:hypothetical protein
MTEPESKTTKGWTVYNSTSEGDPIEVAPNDDLMPHISGAGCWCKPFWDEEILVHNAMDERERYERGERKVS